LITAVVFWNEDFKQVIVVHCEMGPDSTYLVYTCLKGSFGETIDLVKGGQEVVYCFKCSQSIYNWEGVINKFTHAIWCRNVLSEKSDSPNVTTSQVTCLPEGKKHLDLTHCCLR